MSNFTKKRLVPLFLAVLMLMSVFPVATFADIAKKDTIGERWVKDVEIDAGWTYTDATGDTHTSSSANLSLHYIDSDGSGTWSSSEIAYCLNKSVAAKDSVATLAKGDNLKKTDYWLYSLSDKAKEIVTRATIYGYPNYSGDYNSSGASSADKIYATQILIWEATTNQRTSYTSATPCGHFGRAFTKSTGAATGYSDMVSVDFTKAANYYKGLVNACKNHKTVTNLNSSYTVDSLGNHTYTDSLLSGCTVESLNPDVLTASITGNTLTVNVRQGKTGSIRLHKKITETVKQTPCMVNASGAGQQLLYGTIADPITVTLSFDASSLQGGWQIKKQDGSGAAIQNVVFGVYTDKSSLDSQEKSGSNWMTYRTDADGLITTSMNWDAGVTHYFREIGYYDATNKVLHLIAEALPAEQVSGTTYKGPSIRLNTATTGFTIVVDDASPTMGNAIIGTSGGTKKPYRFNPTVGSVTIVNGGQTLVKFGSNAFLTNTEAKGGITVMKTDKDGNPVKDAEFGVYSDKNCTKQITTIKTDGGGRANYGGKTNGSFSLTAGVTYYFKELSAPKGYTVNPEVLSATTVADTLTYATPEGVKGSYIMYHTYYEAYNSTSGRVIFYFQDADGKYVTGTRVTLYRDAACTDKIFRTYDSTDGRLWWCSDTGSSTTRISLGNSTLTPGSYYAKVTVPGGLKQANNVVFGFNVSKNTDTNVVIRDDNAFVNHKNGALKIRKMFKGNPVEGFNFDVFEDASCTKQIDTITTNLEGWATVGVSDGYYELDCGKTYYFKESAKQADTLHGVALDLESVWSGTVIENSIAEVAEVVNTATTKGGIVIAKTDENGNPLNGVTFGIYSDEACTNKITEVKTGARGTVSYGGEDIDHFTLESGTTYYIKELSAPAYYLVDNTVRSVTVVAQKATFVSSTAKQSSIGYITSNNVKSSKGGITVTAYSASGMPLEGAVINLYTDMTCTNAISDGTLVTSDNGVATYSEGTGAFDNYALTPATYYAKVDTEATKEATGVELEPVVYTLVVKANAVTALYIYDNAVLVNKTVGGIAIKKVDQSGGPLAGAKFGVYTDNACHNKVGEMTSGSNGFAYFYGEGTTLATSTLISGDVYYVKEISAPIGYDLVNEVYKVAVGTKAVTANPPVIKNLHNGAIRVKKVDDAGNALEGVRIGVYSDAECKTQITVLTTASDGFAYYYGKNGTSLSNSTLTPGTKVFFKEVEGLEGYEVSTTVLSATAAANQVVTAGTLTNKRYGAFALQKIDADTGRGLNSVILKIYESSTDAANDENAVATLVTSTNNTATGTDKDGWIVYGTDKISGYTQEELTLKAGTTYYIKEISAPAGYIIDTSVKTITVPAGSVSENPAFIENTKNGTVTIVKKDNSVSGERCSAFGFVKSDVKNYGEVSRYLSNYVEYSNLPAR